MSPHTTRRALLGAGVGALTSLAGCLGIGGVPVVSRGDGDGGDDAIPGSADGSPPTADRSLPLAYELGALRKQVVSGGPGKDGIPSVDEPGFVSPRGAEEFLAPGDPVFGVAGDHDVKAYPQKILVWHEIVNDLVDGNPVSVSYCPLTGTAMGFYRGGTTFGVSGDLVNNNLIMYDRESDSRWSQVLGTAIKGTHEGASLREFRLVWTSWERWRGAYPETRVLSRDTGFARDYTRDPYGSYNPPEGYYADDGFTLFATIHEDDRLGGKDVVLGTRGRDGVLAFEKASLRNRGTIAADHEGTAFVAVYDDSLDTGYVYRNDRDASVEWGTGGVLVDGDRFDVDSLPLERRYAFDAMWFAWSGFYPETGLYA